MSIGDDLVQRASCYSYGRRVECNRSSWYYWGRWVLAGIAILAFFFVLLSCCLIARRRRRRGTQPYYGTGWMAPPPKYSTHQDYQLNQQNAGSYSGNPPPAYGQTPHQPQYSGTTTYNPNDGYYGGPQYPDVQSPPNAYQPTNVYPPPPAVPGQTK